MTSPFSPLSDDELQELDNFLLCEVECDESMTMDMLGTVVVYDPGMRGRRSSLQMQMGRIFYFFHDGIRSRLAHAGQLPQNGSCKLSVVVHVGTAGFERSFVKGYNREPCPPPRIRLTILMVFSIVIQDNGLKNCV